MLCMFLVLLFAGITLPQQRDELVLLCLHTDLDLQEMLGDSAQFLCEFIFLTVKH